MMLKNFLVRGGRSVYNPAGVTFSSGYMRRLASLSGAADSRSGIFSGWFRMDGGDSTSMQIFTGCTTLGGSTLDGISVVRGTSNSFFLTLVNTTAPIMSVSANTTTLIAGSGWHHFYVSWFLDTPTVSLAWDGSFDITTALLTIDTADLTKADWGIGARCNGANQFNGCFADIYFTPGQFLPATASNISLFRSPQGRPVNLGSDGSRPTGSVPLVYHHVDQGEASSNFALNRGSGGNFTITGSLSASSTNP